MKRSHANSLTVLGISAFALSLAAVGAQADVLPVQNLTFNQLTNPFNPANSQKDFFNSVQPLNWSVGTAGADGTLTYVGQQGSEGFQGGSGNVYPVYTDPGFSVTVPAGTNFFQADGNPDFENTIFQTISGLTAGTTYTLQFQQAAGQQVGFTGDTTEQWKVFLGVGGIGVDCSSNPCTVTGTADNLENDSTLMNTPSQHNINWNSVTMSFTPTAAELNSGSAVLTFLAWGDGGSTTNLPPTVFLEGVNTPPTSVPEPSTWAMMGLGFLGLAFMGRRRLLAKRAVATA
jgi:PEP-CTERM motif